MGKLSFLFQLFVVNSSFRCVDNCRHLSGLSNLTRIFMSSVSATCSLKNDFQEFQFSPSKLIELPIDEIRDNYIRRNIKGAIFSFVDPTPIIAPSLVHYSEDVLTEILNLDPSVAKSKEFIEFVAGNSILKSSAPLAHRYGGHQFGYWAMQLGDGRAILLGEYVNSNGERWELQLKGSGKTPYSRDGDGRAVLRSSIREFLCSEAMYYLGIPTSRAAAIVVGKNKVMRDLLYDGHPILESVAIVLRIAPSWFRFGSLEILTKNQEKEELETLVNFIIEEHFPNLKNSEDKLIKWYETVCRTTSELVVLWQGVGFTHGVLNTDNMSLLGVTIDYGPFGFMENFNFMYVPNNSDSEARYCYGQQPKVIIYNLVKLAEAISPLLNSEQLTQVNNILKAQVNFINDSLNITFSKKLGFTSKEPELVDKLLNMLSDTKSDLTMSFRQLSETKLSDLPLVLDSWPLDELSKHEDFNSFFQLYEERLKENGISESVRMERMCKINPRYVLRNWMAQEAIKKAENGDYKEVERLLRVLKRPYTRQEEGEKSGYASKPPQWSKSLRLSCSS